jgi:N-dimethylarginine dimethylaminohydrolase
MMDIRRTRPNDTTVWTAQSMYAPLNRVLMKHPRDAFRSQSTLASEWAANGFRACPDYDRAVREFEQLVEMIAPHVDDIVYAPPDRRAGIDSVYVHDAVVVTDRGAVLGHMTKPQRQGEPEAMEDALRSSGVSILGRIRGRGRLEAGDVLWLDERRVAIGVGPRSNVEGARQLQHLACGVIDEVIVVPLPPGSFHLLGLVSIVDSDLAVASERLPRAVRDQFSDRGVTIVDVPRAEEATLACNVLALGPRRCVMAAGSPETVRRLESAGATVLVYEGNEISLKGNGGPTCLTRPLRRRSSRSLHP